MRGAPEPGDGVATGGVPLRLVESAMATVAHGLQRWELRSEDAAMASEKLVEVALKRRGHERKKIGSRATPSRRRSC